MDETDLNWKIIPARTLATKAYNRTKKSKDRITITLISNVNRLKKFKP